MVLIESDWNLKTGSDFAAAGYRKVLIESDWNLKSYRRLSSRQSKHSINRIRLEFKGFCRNSEC